MKTTATLAASAALLLSNAAAQQFVQYSGGEGTDSVQRADPVLAPGVISQHVHQIFGSNAFAPELSSSILQGGSCSTVGDASGNGNAQDNSVYWHPALFAEASDGSGYVRVPVTGHKLYYKNAGTGTPRSPFEFPPNFRMLTGNPFMRDAAPDLPSQNITQWICHTTSGPWNQGTAGGFPKGVSQNSCGAYPGFNGAIHFPHCWNGQDFNIATPTAHVTYPDDNIEDGPCPSSHPTRLPHIFIENEFDLTKVAKDIKEDSFVLAMGDNTGYGWHSDFFNGWDEGALPELFNSCPQGSYGNEDIGSCPSFKKSSTSNSDCPLKTFFKENVDAPGQDLPGCNPVRDTNPAPYYETAPLGTYSTDCTLVGGGSGNGTSPAPVSSASSYTSTPTPPSSTKSKSASSATTKPTTSATTIATSVKSSKTKSAATKSTTTAGGKSPSSPTSSAISCPASDGKTYTVSGKSFQVQCGVDHSGGNLKMTYVQNLEGCLEACATTSGCVDVSLSGTACYMKSSVGATVMSSGISGAKLVSGSSKRHMHHHAAKHARRSLL